MHAVAPADAYWVHEPNPVWFGYRGGEAALLRGLHVGDRFFARNWDDPEDANDGGKRAAFLDWAQAQGYNLISTASFLLNRDVAGRGKGWQTPRLWPLNPEEYRFAENILDDLAARRMVVFPFAGLFGRASGFPTNAADQVSYIRYVQARFGSYGNLLWNVAGPEPLLSNNSYLTRGEVNRLGEEFRRWNVFGTPVSVHNQTGNDEFMTESWPSYGVLQGPKTADRLVLGRALAKNHHPRRPLMAQETLWSGNQHHIRALGRDYTDEDLRRHTLVAHFSGAVIVFADNKGDSSSGFSGTMDLKDCREGRHASMRRAWDLCAEVPFGAMRPRQDLVSGDHAYCLADPGRQYAIYFDGSEAARVRLEAGRYDATWIDASEPGKRIQARVDHGMQPLRPPPGGEDWVALLSRVSGS